MTSQPEENQENKDYELERDILSGRQFSLADLIAREGGGFLKGESPVPKLVQVKTEIKLFIASNLSDLSGALQAVLQNWIDSDEENVSKYQDLPLLALGNILQGIIDNDNLLYDFVRQVDLKWGQMYDERPYFQQPGQIPHPEDEYTHESVKMKLIDLLHRTNQNS